MATPTAPSRGLTPKGIEALRPTASRYEVADRRAPGLRLRVMPSGKKIFRWYISSRGRVLTIGPWAASEAAGVVTLAQARDWLEKLKAAHAAGSLDAVEAELHAHLCRRERIADPAPVDRRTFKAVVEEFYTDDIVANRKRPEDARRVLDIDLLPALGARMLEDVTTLECRDVVKRTIARGAKVQAGRVLALLKQFFNWAQANGFTDRNPAAPLRGRHLGVEVNISDRCLSAEEIPIFWRALDADPGPKQVVRPDPRTGKVQAYAQHLPTIAPATAAALKVLLMTGARTGELLRARWEHVDLKAATWLVPPENQKLTRVQERRAKPFVIPLPATALGLFEELEALAEGSPWVMASHGADDEPEAHYSERALGRAMRRLQEGTPPLLALPGGEASPHDLRRTMRTHLGKLRVPLHIVERCLNHSLGRIVQTYDVGDYLEERREALEKWDAFVLRLLDPTATNVIPLVAEGAR